MQYIGTRVFAYLETLDDETMTVVAREQWRCVKLLVFEVVNHFSAITIAVAYQAFASGTKWLIEPPSCFSPMCQHDIEIQVFARRDRIGVPNEDDCSAGMLTRGVRR